MTEAMREYRALERRLWFVRWRNEGRESRDEEELLEEMEEVWNGLEDGERCLLNEEGPRCWPLEQGGWVPTLVDAASRMTPEQIGYSGFSSVEETIQHIEPARAA
jgi:hypothetical protein